MSDYSVFAIENTLVLWWHKSMTLDGVEECARYGQTLMQRRKIGFLTIMDADVNLKAPTDARRAMADFLQQNGNRIAAAAIAYEVDGFKASAVRSIITAVNIASRSKFPNKVFSRKKEAIDWLGDAIGLPVSGAARLLQECEEREMRLAG